MKQRRVGEELAFDVAAVTCLCCSGAAEKDERRMWRCAKTPLADVAVDR
jgi:hypothetical protein